MNVSRSYKVGWKNFLIETSPDERALLRAQIIEALLYFLTRDQPVFLERFGILYPTRAMRKRTETHKNKNFLLNEKIRKADFEKCADLTDYHRKSFPKIVETPLLAKRIYAQLPLENQSKWSEKTVAAYLRTLIAAIRDEVAIDGFSSQLAPVGTFYALHNRQGIQVEDWFAGADIFVTSQYKDTLFAKEPRAYPRPILKNPAEPFEALHGEPLRTLRLDIRSELILLGYEHVDETDYEETEIGIDIFYNSLNNSLIACSEGFRKLSQDVAKENSQQTGTGEKPISSEVVFQLAKTDILTKANIRLIRRVFTLAWMLVQGRPSKTLRPGLALCSERPLYDSSTRIHKNQNEIVGILATVFEPIQLVQETAETEFRYINVAGITAEEMKVAELYSADRLTQLLRFKRYHQLTNLSRPSVTHRTGLLQVTESVEPAPRVQ